MKKLFLDTEFTDLVPHNKLISIALVDESGDYFYAELTDTYTEEDCSSFVVSSVLPFLRGAPYRMSRHEAALKLGNWIDDRECKCIIASDAPSWDLPHLVRVIGDCWPENLLRDQIYPVRVPDDVEAEIVAEFGYDIHNALDDARVMAHAYNRSASKGSDKDK